MATGGIFQLITNDGKQDRMLMASDLLKQRLADATAARQAQQLSDCTPTLYDIERTHILFTNAHFKPFAAIGYEYNKVNTTAGSAAYGSEIQFSIPQFGDFFNDMILHATLTQPVLNTTGIDPSDQYLFRWCSFPGERLLENVSFNVNGNPLDLYERPAVNYHREFSVQPNKMLSWHRCMGQEEPEIGYIDQPNWVNSGIDSKKVGHRVVMETKSGAQTPTGVKTEPLELFIPLLFWCNKDPRLAVPSVAIPYGQRFINMKIAPYTEMYGTVARGVNVGKVGSFSTQSTISKLELYINNIFVNPEVHNIFIKRIGFSLIRVHRKQDYSVTTSESEVLLQGLKWPIEALFVGLRPSQYLSTSDSVQTNDSMDKWYRFCQAIDTPREFQGWNASKRSIKTGTTVASVLGLNTFTGVFTVHAGGTTPATIESGTNLNGHVSAGDVFTWTTALQPNLVATARVARVAADGLGLTLFEIGTDLVKWDNIDLALSTVGVSSITLTRGSSEALKGTVVVCKPTLALVSIRAHGISIYDFFPNKFYNAYLPYNYGGPNIKTPEDVGALMITFCLYPGTYQPSGHINVSRAREFYIAFKTVDVKSWDVNGGASVSGTLYVVASAINFLLISDGSAVLRYST
jgi:hypothetical protein